MKSFVEPTGDEARDSLIEAVLASLADLPLSTLLAADSQGVRLARLLAFPRIAGTTLRGYVDGRRDVEAWIMRQRNCGRVSVRELCTATAASIARTLVDAGLSPGSARSSAETLFDVTLPKDAILGRTPVFDDVEAAIRWHSGGLALRHAHVLSERFGLDGRPPRTLAEIGQAIGVTRERIRQIEADALGELRNLCSRMTIPLAGLLASALVKNVGILFDGAVHVLDESVDRHLAGLHGHLALALEVSRLHPRCWLTSALTKLGRGWLRDGVDPSSITSMVGRLDAAWAGNGLPIAVADLSLPDRRAEAVAAAELLLGWHLSGGYLFRRRPGRRATRTAAAHAVLHRTGRTLGVVDLLDAYRNAFPADRCSDRDLVIVMEAATHLFLEVEEGRWSALGTAGEPPPLWTSDQGSSENAFDAEDEAEDGESIADALERTLERQGPTRLGRLIADAADIVPAGRSPRSVGPTLLLNPARFVRVLPGVYALPDQVPSEDALRVAEDIEYLLNASQARIYAMARHAGETWGRFPLWTPVAEMRLCRWARAGADMDLFRSLLSVASIGRWPIGGSEKEAWSDLRRRQARYELGFAAREVDVELPPDRLLAAALHLSREGAIGWVSVNRILRYRPDAHAASRLLDAFVYAGLALRPPGAFAWQAPHLPGATLPDFVGSLSAALHRDGRLGWDDPALAGLVQFASSHHSTEKVSDALEEDELRSLMDEHRRAVRARALQSRFDATP